MSGIRIGLGDMMNSRNNSRTCSEDYSSYEKTIEMPQIQN